MTFHASRIDLCSICLLFVLSGISRAEDWLQYRGPTHNGIVAEKIRTNWADESPRQIWKIPLGPAYSTFSISGGRAITQVSRAASGREQEFCIALDAETGLELWATRLDIADYDSGAGSDDGPRSTPSIDGDRVYVLTSHLQLACLEAATGQIVWNKNLESEFGGRAIVWQNAASPLIIGDLILLNCNGPKQRLMALNKQDGSVAWKAHDDPMTQSTPVTATIADTPQVIFFTQTGLVSVRTETGDLLWRYPFPYSTSTAASPVVVNDLVYCSAAYGIGAGTVRITKTGESFTATEVWRTPGANMNHWATPVHHEGHLYGMYGQTIVSLRCVDFATGDEKWRKSGLNRGGLVLVNDHLLVLAEDGALVLVKPDPTAYVEVARYQAVHGKCWNIPSVSNGRIYARSTSEAACFDVSVKALSKLKFLSNLGANAEGFQLFLGSDDGSPIDLNRFGKIDIFSTSDLSSGSAGWIKVTSSPILTNGLLRLDAPASAEPQRFFRAQERP